MRGVVAIVVSLVASPVWGACSETGLAAFAEIGGAGADCESEAGACRWTYALGAAESRTVFETMRDRFAACSDQMSMVRDAGVNHPDFYDAWLITFDGHAFSLSLKDKAALKQSFVVLRELPNS